MTRRAALVLMSTVGIIIAFVGLALFVSAEDKLQWGLTEAASRGDLAEVKRLFGAGAKLDAFPQREGTEGGSPALHGAVAGGHEDVVRFFIEHGANLEITFSDVGSPLAVAVGRRHYSIAELLLAHGASVNHAVRQVLTPTSWEPPLDGKTFELLKSYGAVTQTKFKRVPPSPFLCIGKLITESEIVPFLDQSVPAIYAALQSARAQDAGLLHINYTGRNLRHPGPFYIEVAVPFDNDKHQVPNGYYFRTAAEFKCFAGETSGLRKNIDFGAHIIETRLWTDGKAYPTFDMREVYRRWKSANSKETLVEIQFGIHHPARDEHGKRYQEQDRLTYEPGE
jgi:hypothetical protein